MAVEQRPVDVDGEEADHRGSLGSFGSSGVSRSRFLEPIRDVARQALGRRHPGEWAEAQDPALERPIEADVERER